jgi:Anti-sigma factor NepR
MRNIGCGAFGMNATRTKKVEPLDTAAAPDPKSVEAIGRALEKHYASLIEAPLPDKFVELLARLEREQVPPTPPGSPDALD